MTEYRSNQGSTMISPMLDDVNSRDLAMACEPMWREIHNHPNGASCECPAIELLCALYEMGYRITKPEPVVISQVPDFFGNSRRCPTCKAGPDTPCRTKNGHIRSLPHAARMPKPDEVCTIPDCGCTGEPHPM